VLHAWKQNIYLTKHFAYTLIKTTLLDCFQYVCFGNNVHYQEIVFMHMGTGVGSLK